MTWKQTVRQQIYTSINRRWTISSRPDRMRTEAVSASMTIAYAARFIRIQHFTVQGPLQTCSGDALPRKPSQGISETVSPLRPRTSACPLFADRCPTKKGFLHPVIQADIDVRTRPGPSTWTGWQASGRDAHPAPRRSRSLEGRNSIA
jgi:hypothetical protein